MYTSMSENSFQLICTSFHSFLNNLVKKVKYFLPVNDEDLTKKWRQILFSDISQTLSARILTRYWVTGKSDPISLSLCCVLCAGCFFYVVCCVLYVCPVLYCAVLCCLEWVFAKKKSVCICTLPIGNFLKSSFNVFKTANIWASFLFTWTPPLFGRDANEQRNGR